MTKKLPSLLTLMAVGLLASCKSEPSGTTGGLRAVPATPPPPPSAEVLAAMEAQPAGKKFLGRTRLLVGETLVKSDFQHAPEYYLIHYSASW